MTNGVWGSALEDEGFFFKYNKQSCNAGLFNLIKEYYWSRRENREKRIK